jgi:hypothetical protein
MKAKTLARWVILTVLLPWLVLVSSTPAIATSPGQHWHPTAILPAVAAEIADLPPIPIRQSFQQVGASDDDITPPTAAETAALGALYNATGGANWKDRSG